MTSKATNTCSPPTITRPLLRLKMPLEHRKLYIILRPRLRVVKPLPGTELSTEAHLGTILTIAIAKLRKKRGRDSSNRNRAAVGYSKKAGAVTIGQFQAGKYSLPFFYLDCPFENHHHFLQTLGTHSNLNTTSHLDVIIKPAYAWILFFKLSFMKQERESTQEKIIDWEYQWKIAVRGSPYLVQCTTA